MERSQINQARVKILNGLPFRALHHEISWIGDQAVTRRAIEELLDEKQITLDPISSTLRRLEGAPMAPSYHKGYEVGSRVAFTLTGAPDEETLTGRIDGICFQHVFYTYMVTLDKPLADPKSKNWLVIPVHGTLITAEL